MNHAAPMTTASIDSAVSSLKNSLRGDLLLPEDPAYDAVRAIWNGMIDRRPSIIARCLGPADVQAALAFARANDMPVAIRSGGHNIAGLSICDGGLLADLSLMRGVRVDPTRRTAHAQAGCKLSDVDRETQVHGLAAVLGFVSTTGIAGLTLGGGFGYLTPKFGWTCDNVRSMEVVTADGRIVRAAEDEHNDLFWALRGGGGNFGVVTDFEFELHPVGPQIVGGGIAWGWNDARDVLELYREVVNAAPPEMTCVAALRKAPPAPWIDESVHGKPIVAFFICHVGRLTDAESDLSPIRSFKRPVGDVVQRRTYISQQALIDATQPKGRRYYWKSEYLPSVPEEMIDPLIEFTERIPSPHGAILLFPLDGAIGHLPEDHSAAGNRDTGLVLNIAGSWEDVASDEANVAWARNAWEALRVYSTGGSYVNFQTDDEGEERVRSAYRSNYERLSKVKARWDPENVFRMNKNILPAE